LRRAKGQSFNLNGTDSYVSVPASPTLDVGAGQGMTLECWIKPADIASPYAVMEWDNGSGGIGTHFWFSVAGYGGAGALFGDIKTATSDHSLFSVIVDQTKVIYANFSHGPVISVSGIYQGEKSDRFLLTLSGDYNARYQLLSSSNLLTWASLGVLTNGAGTNDFFDAPVSSNSNRFYRALLLP
jgi:hypothetical protein